MAKSASPDQVDCGHFYILVVDHDRNVYVQVVMSPGETDGGGPVRLRIAIVDRGDAAIRMIHAIRETAFETGRRLESVILHPARDRSSLAVREATDAVGVDTVGLHPTGGRIDRLEAALRSAEVDAAWTAWTPAFGLRDLAQACDRLGIPLLGHDEKVQRGLADAVDRERAGGPMIRLPEEAMPPAVGVHIVGNGIGPPACLGEVFTSDAGVESCDSTLDPELSSALRDAGLRCFEEAGARGLATITFTQASRGVLRPSEATCGLQPGHLAIEAVTGVDVAKLQLRTELDLAPGSESPAPTGVALSVGVTVPEGSISGTRVELLRLPTGPGIRVDSGVAEGEFVGPWGGGGVLARITAWGRNEMEARSRLERALAETTAIVSGATTNKGSLLRFLRQGRDPSVAKSHMDESCCAALLNAAIEAHDTDAELERARFLVSAARGRPRVRRELGRAIDLRFGGHPYRLRVFHSGHDTYEVEVGERNIDVQVDRLGKYERNVGCDGKRFLLTSSIEGAEHVIEVDGLVHRITRDDGGLVRAPAPAVVIAILVEPGDRVSAGDPVAVLEAMKMQTYVSAPFPGQVSKVLVAASMQVDAGAPLVRFAPAAQEEAPVGEPVSFDRLPARSDSSDEVGRCVAGLVDLRRRVLGWDTSPRWSPVTDSDWSVAAADPDALRRIINAEDEILSIFAGVTMLARKQGLASDERVHAPQDDLLVYLRTLNAEDESLSSSFRRNLRAAFARYEIDNMERSEPLEDAVFRIFRSLDRSDQHVPAIVSILERRLEQSSRAPRDEKFRRLLDQLITATQRRYPNVADLARSVRHRFFVRPLLEDTQRRVYAEMEGHLAALERNPSAPDRADRIEALVHCPQPLAAMLRSRFRTAAIGARTVMLEVLILRYYRTRKLAEIRTIEADGRSVVHAQYKLDGRPTQLIATFELYPAIKDALLSLVEVMRELPANEEVVVDLHSWREVDEGPGSSQHLISTLNSIPFPRPVRMVNVSITASTGAARPGATEHFVFSPGDNGFQEDTRARGLHPMMAERLGLWRLVNFEIERLPSVEDVYLFHAVAYDNPRDERLIAVAEVRDLTPVRDANGRIAELPHLERIFTEALAGIRMVQSQRRPHRRLHWNRVLLYVWPVLDLQADELLGIVYKLARLTEGLGLEKVDVLLKMKDAESGTLQERVLEVTNPVGRDLAVRLEPVHQRPIRPVSAYSQKVLRMRQRGLVYPYEIVRILTFTGDEGRAGFPPGNFTEYDIDDAGELVPVDRPYGANQANIVVGVIRNFTAAYPEGMARVALLGDPSKGLGSLAAPECLRIVKGIELAESLGIPVEWFAVSAGAKIAMDSGTENMDWIGQVLKSLIRFTQQGGEVNVIVCGINVGAQPYWNAEATMLMHTRGILIMTSDGAMVLTGKQALDYSGGVSAADNYGIGGYENVMGPNGQAQYWARDVGDACRLLLRYYGHTYKVPGERFPRRAQTGDPIDRDVRLASHKRDEFSSFEAIREVFSEDTNPGRKKPFDIRSVMKAVVDTDNAPLERWAGMQDAETAVVWDAHIGGWPICLLGIESKPLPRKGFIPADGPDHWTSGTLFPRSSKKIARAINSASGNRPFVVLANLSGFDGSPDSMRNLQLEYGAEIGRAVVNFDGPLVFCVVSRYHGGAFVVFSATLNDDVEVAAVEGSFASVIGGAPAAAVVFARDVDARTDADPRLQELRLQINAAEGAEQSRLRKEYDNLRKAVRTEKVGEVADEFDNIHTIHRALEVGSVHRIIAADRIRPYLVDAIERGVKRTLERIERT